MIVGILQEPKTDNRVSLLPEQAATLVKQNITVQVEAGAGARAFATNGAYEDKGVQVAPRQNVLHKSDIIFSINAPSDKEIATINPTALLIGVYQPLFRVPQMKMWAAKNITCCSLDAIPRTTRAQSMDVLSSQANIAGYRAVLAAANLFPRYFPMFITAAGSIPPAKVLILGAGVAGLQAIATAKRLGAAVEVFDTRPAVKEEVMSLGAKFIEVVGAADSSKAGGYAVEQSKDYEENQHKEIAKAVAKADIIITTAQIPGKKAPILVTEEMMQSMKNGSIVIDLAASTGGNTPFTKNNETIVTKNGVTILGDSCLQRTMPFDASKMYGKNLLNFLQLILTKEGELNLNFEDDIVKGCCITHNKQVVNERMQPLL